MSKISKTKAATLIMGSKGKFFTAVVATKSNPERVINCQYRAGNKPKNPTTLGMVRVWETSSKSYKTINLQTLKGLKMDGQTYTV